MAHFAIRNYINGQWRETAGGPAVPLYNPSTGEQISLVPQSGREGFDFFTQNKVTTIRTIDPHAHARGEQPGSKFVRSCVAS